MHREGMDPAHQITQCRMDGTMALEQGLTVKALGDQYAAKVAFSTGPAGMHVAFVLQFKALWSKARLEGFPDSGLGGHVCLDMLVGVLPDHETQSGHAKITENHAGSTGCASEQADTQPGVQLFGRGGTPDEISLEQVATE